MHLHDKPCLFPIRSAAGYGCSQLVVCIHTTDHTADIVYIGTGDIRKLIDNMVCQVLHIIMRGEHIHIALGDHEK